MERTKLSEHGVGVECRCKGTILTCTLLDMFVGSIFTILCTVRFSLLTARFPVSRLTLRWLALCRGTRVGERLGKECQGALRGGKRTKAAQTIHFRY